MRAGAIVIALHESVALPTGGWPCSSRGPVCIFPAELLAPAPVRTEASACEPRYSRSRKIAADGEDATRRTRQRGQDIPAGSNRSPFNNIRSATAIAARLAEPQCSPPEGA